MGMKDQFQDKSEQWQQQAKQKAQEAKEQAQQRGKQRGDRDPETERLQQEEQDRFDQDYDA